jgi:NADH:ubiquinone oxidoreductase subunit K
MGALLMSTDITDQQPSGQYEYTPNPQTAVMTVKDWIITMIISAIPLLNIVMLFVWAFGDNTNLNKKSFARASLILAAIGIVLYIALIVLIFMIAGVSEVSKSNFF